MATNNQRFLKGTDNAVLITLTKDDVPIPNLENASQVDITFGGIVISRSASVSGVNFSLGGGLLVIIPGQLTEDLSGVPDQMMPAVVRVFDGQNPEGVVFGGADSDPRLMFSVRTPIG